MAGKGKISEDKIRMTVDVETAKSQQHIHELTNEMKEAQRKQKEYLQQMVKLEMAHKKTSKEYKTSAKEYNALGKNIKDLKEQIADETKKLDVNAMTMNQLKRQAKDLRRALDDTSQATNPERYAELESQLSAVTGRMSELKQDAKGLREVLTEDATQSFMMGSLLVKMTELVGRGLKNVLGFITENIDAGIEMARNADGVTKAFNELNRSGLLDNLREATKGTVNDMDLMKAAVQANDFKIPLEELGTYLSFAQLKAQQTGQSVEYMTNSIVTGLGRKSVMILDNLGISAAEIKENMKKTGDFSKAVAVIIEQQLAKAGETYVSAADRAAQRTVRLQNAQKALGDELLPLREAYEDAYGLIQMGIIQTMTWMIKHREVIVALVLAMVGLTVATVKQTGALAGNAIATKASAAAHAIWNQVATTTKGLLIVLRSGFYLLTGRVVKARAEWSALNATMKTNLIYLAITAVVALGAALYTWSKRVNQVSQEQRTLNAIREKASQKVEEERIKIDMLTKRIHDNALSINERRTAIEQLQKIVPDYTAKLSAEGKVYDENTTALTRYLNALKEKALLEGAQEEIKKLGQQKAQLLIQQRQQQQDLDDLRQEQGEFLQRQQGRPQTSGGAVAPGSIYAQSNYSANIKGLELAINKTGGQIAVIDRTLDAIGKEFGKKLFDEQNAGGGGGGGNGGKGNAAPDPDVALAKQYDDAREESLKKWRLFYEQRQVQLKEALVRQQLTQEQYDTQMRNLELLNTSKILAVEKAYYENSEGLAFKDATKKKELRQRYQGYVETAEQNETNAKLAVQQLYFQALDKITEAGKVQQTLTLEQEKEAELAVLEGYYKTALERAKLYGEDEVAVTEAYESAKLNITQKYTEKAAQLQLQARQKYGLLSDSERLAQELKTIKDDYDKGLLSKEEYERAVAAKEKEYADKRKQQRIQLGVERQTEYQQRLQQLKDALAQGLISEQEYEKAVRQLKMDSWRQQFDYYAQLFGGAMKALQDAEMANIDAKYDAEIEAAKGNAEKVEELENKKANEKLKVQKKYADVNFAIQASQIIANTAVSIMKALSELGPIAGPIAAALMGVTGAAQLAAANAERQKVKKMTLSGSSGSSSVQGTRVATGYEEGGHIDVEREQDGKKFHAKYDPTRRGYIDRPTVIVGEGPTGKSKEWVASNAALANPTVAPLIDIIDRAQRVGNISTLDMRKYLLQRQTRGLESGGSVSPGSTIGGTAVVPASLDPALVQRLYAVLEHIDTHGIPAYVALDEFDAEQKRREQSRKIGSKE